MPTRSPAGAGSAEPFNTAVEPGRTARSRAADAARVADAARALRYARYNRLRRLAEDEGLSVEQVMTGRAVPRRFGSIVDRRGRIVPELIDFYTPEL